jgi:SAM-dependent methyltransferase
MSDPESAPSAHTAHLLSEAAAALGNGRPEDAEACVRAVLIQEPTSLLGRRILADIHRARGDIDGAVAVLAEATALAPGATAHFLDLGHFLRSVGRIREANDAYHSAAQLAPADGYPREVYGQSLTEEWMLAMGLRKVGREASKSYAAKLQSGFFRTYLGGAQVLDIGFRGSSGEASPIVEQAVGVDLGFPGYDGVTLPFPSNSQDAVHSSHCLEHTEDPVQAIREWFRVLKIGGYLVLSVPHQHLYEKKEELPSAWNHDHRHFFSPARLLAVVEEALAPNHYRIRHFVDNDFLYDYDLPSGSHPVGCYEIELVIQKIRPPAWELA